MLASPLANTLATAFLFPQPVAMIITRWTRVSEIAIFGDDTTLGCMSSQAMIFFSVGPCLLWNHSHMIIYLHRPVLNEYMWISYMHHYMTVMVSPLVLSLFDYLAALPKAALFHECAFYLCRPEHTSC